MLFIFQRKSELPCTSSESPSFSSPLPAPPVGPGSRDAAAPALQPGDVVEVVEGDLKHLTGKVVFLEGDNVTIKPNHKDLQVSA